MWIKWGGLVFGGAGVVVVGGVGVGVAEAGGLEHAGGGEVVAVAFGGDAFEAPEAEGVVGHCADGFGGEAVVLVVWEESDAELDGVVVGEVVEDGFADEDAVEVDAEGEFVFLLEVVAYEVEEPFVSGVAFSGPCGAPVPSPVFVVGDVSGEFSVVVGVFVGDGVEVEALGGDFGDGVDGFDDAAWDEGVFVEEADGVVLEF